MAEAPGLPDLSARRSRLLGTGDRRGLILSTTSTVVVLAVLAGIFLLAPGSRAVRTTFFNPTDMWRALVGDPKAGYYSVGEALWLNIRMFVIAEILILILALVVAVIRQSTGPVLLPLRVVGTIYVDVARGVPLILVIFAIGFGVPALQLLAAERCRRVARRQRPHACQSPRELRPRECAALRSRRRRTRSSGCTPGRVFPDAFPGSTRSRSRPREFGRQWRVQALAIGGNQRGH